MWEDKYFSNVLYLMHENGSTYFVLLLFLPFFYRLIERMGDDERKEKVLRKNMM